MSKRTIFVYGTLKRGEFNDIERYTPCPVFIGTGWVAGHLFDLGHCPAMQVGGADPSRVWGEVFELEESLFTELDQYEDKCGDFPLQQVSVQLADRTLAAWTYVGGPRTDTSCPLPAGVWSAPRRLAAEDLHPLGDQAILVDFSRHYDGLRLELLLGFAQAVRKGNHRAVLDVVEAPDSVTVYYQADLLADAQRGTSAFAQIRSHLLDLPITAATVSARKHNIPVCYAPEFAPDLQTIAVKLGVSPESIINQHMASTYKVSSQGFLPGFAYLHGVPANLRLPRLASPRTQVAAGSVGLAEDLCGIYPGESPGGWNLIGRTPLKLFEPSREEPALFRAGDAVAFTPLTRDEFWEASHA